MMCMVVVILVVLCVFFFFFKQKTAYEMRISDWSSDVCSSDLPYTPLELAGRNIYMREGCYTCHSQMIRPFRDEVERYGHYSLAAESMYDHPFQWGSKRTGPDLARVGGRYSDEWHRAHLIDPRSVVPESIMPPYAFLSERELEPGDMANDLTALYRVGVPYTQDDIAKANDDIRAQADPDAGAGDLATRYPKVQVRDFDGEDRKSTRLNSSH